MPRREPAATCAALLEEGYIYVDVRTVSEFDAGHPNGAYNVPAFVAGAGGMAPNPSFVDEMKANFEADTKIVVGCRSGGRSLKALHLLEAAGYTNIVDNEAGWLGSGSSEGWSPAGLPTATQAEAGRDYASLKR